jgi:hypothetical protein
MFRVLKPGGRITVCDNVLEEPFPVRTENEFDIWTSCVAGALLKQEYINVITEKGFKDFILVEGRSYHTRDDDIPVNVTNVTIKSQKP